MSSMSVEVVIDLDDLAESFMFKPYDEIIRFILEIDGCVADSVFTELLIGRLESSRDFDEVDEDLPEVEIE